MPFSDVCMLSPQSARLAPSLRSSSSWCWLGNGAALAALFMVTAVANLYLFHYSRGLYATELQPFPAGDSAVSAAELTRAWTMRAAEDALARHVSDAAAAPVGAVLSVQGLGFQPFDPNQKINVGFISLKRC